MSDSENLVFKNSKESEQALEFCTEQEFNKTQGKYSFLQLREEI